MAGSIAAELLLLRHEPAQAIFDDDHRTIDNDAEIDGAKAHEIGAYLVLDHAGDGKQHGQWNDARGCNRRPEVSKGQEQDSDDQESAFDQILFDGHDGRLDEARPVVDGMRDHALGQRTPDLLEFGGDALRHGAAAPVLAVRSSSVVFATLLAGRLLAEDVSPSRIAGSVLVFGGVALLAL